MSVCRSLEKETTTHFQCRDEDLATFKAESFLRTEFLVQKVFEPRSSDQSRQNETSLHVGETHTVGRLELLPDPVYFDGVVDEGVLAADVVAVGRLQSVDDLPKRKDLGFSADISGRGKPGRAKVTCGWN